jgi:hypothetical protein
LNGSTTPLMKRIMAGLAVGPRARRGIWGLEYGRPFGGGCSEMATITARKLCEI